ncbi:MAG TPA: hypothetical protein VKH81_09200 [Candidatus Angelobacter sp.]|nr:hypothetical protein [Candidatus Angelobacter sp.]
MTNLLPHQEFHEPNTSAVTAVYQVLRRQPWDQWARKTLAVMKRLLLLALLLTSLSALPASAQARTYDVLTADVPFQFDIGARAFHPGHYQFIFAGTNLLVLRDARQHNVASLVTRSVETGEPAPATRLVFSTGKKHAQLAEIHIAASSQALEILGEELAVQPAATFAPLWFDNNFTFSFSGFNSSRQKE